MRIRGRRVALLLASALPLLAKEHPVAKDNNVNIPASVGKLSTAGDDVVPDAMMIDEDENDNPVTESAAEAIHNGEDLRLPALVHMVDSFDYPSSDAEMPSGTQTITKSDPDNAGEDTEPPDQSGESSNASMDHSRDDHSEASSEDEEKSTASEAVCDGSESEACEVSTRPEKSDDSGAGEAGEENESGGKDIPDSAESVEGTHDEDDTSTIEDGAKQETMKASEQFDEDDDESLLQVSVDYASKSAGALIIEKSSGFKGTSNLLNGDKDRYAIAPCEERKFVVVGLSEDILVKHIKLANYERFSSSAKDIQIMGSQTLGKWVDLGTYQAKAGNGEETFDLKEPAWARYLKFKFLSHHGVEYYCTYSQIKVHGSTMVQGFHEQWEESHQEEITASTTAEKTGEGDPAQQLDENEESGLVDEGAGVDDNSLNSADDEAKVEGLKNMKQEAAPKGSKANTPGIGLLASSSQLNDKLLYGDLSDEEFFSSLYDLIPSTLNSLPTTSRNSQGRQTTGGDLRSLHQIGGSSVMNSMYSKKKASDTPMIADSTEDISSPTMSDLVHGAINQLGTELGFLMNYSGQPQNEPKIRSTNTTVDATTNDTQPKFVTTLTASNKNATEKQVPKSVEVDMATVGEQTMEASEKASIADEEPSLGQPTGQVTQLIEGVDVTSEDSMDFTLAKMLENLPTSECLTTLDYEDFKENILASKKAHGGGAAATAGANPMEPIFKKLTDEIKSLQTNLSIHDQFTKASVSCYQRVLWDLILETNRVRNEHDQRLRRLEEEFRSSQGELVLVVRRLAWDGISLFYSWLFSATIFLYSSLIVWSTVLAKAFIHTLIIIYRSVLHYWPTLKTALLSTEQGYDLATKYMSPFIDNMDQRVLEMADSDHSFDGNFPEGDGMWRVPVVPIVLLILVGRLIMCFAGPPPRKDTLTARLKLSPSRPQDTSMDKGRDEIPELKPEKSCPVTAQGSSHQHTARANTIGSGSLTVTP